MKPRTFCRDVELVQRVLLTDNRWNLIGRNVAIPINLVRENDLQIQRGTRQDFEVNPASVALHY